MIEEMLSTVSRPFDKERQEFRVLINKLRNKLNTSFGIIDESLIDELERRLAKLEEKIQDINSFSCKEISAEIELLDKKIDELNVYFTLINKVNYINKYIKEKKDITNEDLLGWVRIITNTLESLIQNKYFYLESQEKAVNLTYTTIYKLIKKEILINHESLLLSVIKDDETSKSYICRLISDEIKEIFSGTYAKIPALENLKEVLAKSTDNETTRLLNKDVINAILILNNYESLKSSYFKEYEVTLEVLNKDLQETKNILEEDLMDANEDKKDKIRKLKENKKKTLLPTLFLTSALLFTISNSLVLNDIEHNKVKYDTAIVTYSENIGTKRFSQKESKLTNAIHRKYELGEYGEYEYASSKTLEVCGEEYYDEFGNSTYDYTLYNINEFEFDDYKEFIKIDDDLLKDKVIESGTKEGTPTFKTKLTLKNQDVKSRTLEKPFKTKRTLALIGLVINLLNVPLQSFCLFSQIKDRLKIKSSIKETKNQISSLLNKCTTSLEYNTNLTKLKELSKFLKKLSKIEPFTLEEENLLNIDSHLKEQKELEKKLTIFKNHLGN